MSIANALRSLTTRAPKDSTRGGLPDLNSRAHASAEDGFEGPPKDEPQVHALLMSLRSEASRQFRANPELRAAQARLQAAQRALNALEVTGADTGRPTRPGKGSLEDRVTRTQKRMAQSDRRAAEAAVSAELAAVSQLEARVIDEVSRPIEEGIGAANQYLAAFDAHARYRGNPTIGMLDEGATVRSLVRDAVRPLLGPDGD